MTFRLPLSVIAPSAFTAFAAYICVAVTKVIANQIRKVADGKASIKIDAVLMPAMFTVHFAPFRGFATFHLSLGNIMFTDLAFSILISPLASTNGANSFGDAVLG
jgi:hypothetical protein